MVGTLNQGGAERQLYYMLRVLRERNTDVTVLCLTSGEYWEKEVSALGVAVVSVGRHSARPLRLAKIVHEIHRLRPDVIQSSHFYTNLPAAVAGRLLGIPAIGAVRNDALQEIAAPGAAVGLLHLRTPPWIAANSKAGIRNAIVKGIPPHRLLLLPNVVDCSEFVSAPPKKSGTVLHLVTAGRLVEQKRQDRFIRLIKRLRSESRVRVKGTIVGGGPLRGALERQISELNLTAQDIEIRGPAADMRSVYSEADVFVLTSAWEGTPNVVLEAMASGVPVVGTSVGDVPELVLDGQTGFVVDEHREDDLVARVALLAANPMLRKTFGKNARHRVETEYSLSRLPVYLQRIYATVQASGS